MEYRNIGGSGLQVSVVGLGCNNFGRRLDADATRAVVNRCLDLGINFFDTADVYGGEGRSEQLLGAALKGRRGEVVIATKFSSKMGDGPMMSGGSRRWVMRAVEDSLRRLGTDTIDLYQLHHPDPRTPILETMRALDDLVRQGKVRYIGHSNFAGWQAAEADCIARYEHLTPFVSAQNQWSLVHRAAEQELVPAAERFGLGVLPYFPLASGLLTGKYRRGQAVPQGTRLAEKAAAERWLTDANLDLAEKLEAFARQRGRSLLELAIGWLASHRVVPSVIAGATKPEQVDANVAAAAWKLSESEMTEVDQLSKR